GGESSGVEELERRRVLARLVGSSRSRRSLPPLLYSWPDGRRGAVGTWERIAILASLKSSPATLALFRRHQVEVGDLLAHVLADSRDQVRFDLARALAADSVIVADLLQRERLVGHQSLLEDEALLVLQSLGELGELVAEKALELLVSEADVGRDAFSRQEALAAGSGADLADRRIERHLIVAEALIHLHHILLGDVESLGKELG